MIIKNGLCKVEERIILEMEFYFSPKPFYLVGGNNSGKSGFLWRLQEIIKDKTRMTDLIILSNKNDYGLKYEDGPKTLREAFRGMEELFYKVLHCDWVQEYLLEYCDLNNPEEALDYYNEHDWRFRALVATVAQINSFYYVHGYEHKRVVFALDDFGSIFNSNDLRDMFIYRLMEILHKKYPKVESMTLITTNYNNYRFWVISTGEDDDSIENVCCGGRYYITDDDKSEYLKFFQELNKAPVRNLSQLEVNVFCKLRDLHSPKTLYLLGGAKTGKSMFVKRLEYLAQDYLLVDDIVTLSDRDDVFIPDWIYRHGNICLKHALNEDVELYEEIITSDRRLYDYWVNYVKSKGGDSLYTYNAGDDYRFTAMLRVVHAIKTYYDRHINYKTRSVIFALDNFNSDVVDDMRDLFIMKYLQILDVKYPSIYNTLIITSPRIDDNIISGVSDCYKESNVYTIGCHKISEAEAQEYKDFINNLKPEVKATMKIADQRLQESKELIKEAEKEIKSTKDIIMVGGFFNKDRDMSALMDKLDMKSWNTIFKIDLENNYILGGIANREWYDKVKDIPVEEQVGEFLIFLDINGPLFKKCSFSQLAKMCEVLDHNGISDMVAKFIKDIK